MLGPILAGCETAGYEATGGGDVSVETGSPTTDTSNQSAQGETWVSFGLYTPLFDEGDHLNKLIGNGEMVAAAKLYI